MRSAKRNLSQMRIESELDALEMDIVGTLIKAGEMLATVFVSLFLWVLFFRLAGYVAHSVDQIMKGILQ